MINNEIFIDFFQHFIMLQGLVTACSIGNREQIWYSVDYDVKDIQWRIQDFSDEGAPTLSFLRKRQKIGSRGTHLWCLFGFANDIIRG